MARAMGIPAADAAESQDICFIANGDYETFLLGRLGADAPCFQPGPIVDGAGHTLGEHTGLARFTAGQRKGIGVAAAEPLYVMGKRVAENELVVGMRTEAVCSEVVVRAANLVSLSALDDPIEAEVKTHYRQQPVKAVVHPDAADRFRIIFAEPQGVVAPGQSAVVYQDDAVLAGGIIAESA